MTNPDLQQAAERLADELFDAPWRIRQDRKLSAEVIERHLRQVVEPLERAMDEALGYAAEIENHCPCGARPESPMSHPHVIGCPVPRLIQILVLKKAAMDHDTKQKGEG